MWLQACLNGSRTSTQHPAVPLTPAALAADARRTREAGAASLHVHPRDKAGLESLAPDVVAATLTAIREACPGLEVGISTAAYIEPDLPLRLDLIDAWTALPVNTVAVSKTFSNNAASQIQFNEKEPWTGKWKVESTSQGGGIWAMKQEEKL